MSTINPNQVNTSIFGMASAVFTSLCTALVTLAVKGDILIGKSANTLIFGVSAAENVAEAVEKRSKIYGDGIVRNGDLAERETTLKHKLRLHNLEQQEKAVIAGTATYKPEPSLASKAGQAIKDVVTASAKESDNAIEIKTVQPAG